MIIARDCLLIQNNVTIGQSTCSAALIIRISHLAGAAKYKDQLNGNMSRLSQSNFAGTRIVSHAFQLRLSRPVAFHFHFDGS